MSKSKYLKSDGKTKTSASKTSKVSNTAGGVILAIGGAVLPECPPAGGILLAIGALITAGPAIVKGFKKLGHKVKKSRLNRNWKSRTKARLNDYVDKLKNLLTNDNQKEGALEKSDKLLKKFNRLLEKDNQKHKLGTEKHNDYKNYYDFFNKIKVEKEKEIDIDEEKIKVNQSSLSSSSSS